MFCTTEAPTVPGMPDSPLDALEPELYGEGHEIIPIGTGLGIDMHGAILALYRCSLVRHSDEASGVSNHHAVKRLIGNKQVGAATDDDQGQGFGIGFLHGFDESHARGRLDEMGDGAAHAMVVMSAKLVMAYYLSGAGAISRQSSAETAERPRLNEGGAGISAVLAARNGRTPRGVRSDAGFLPFLTRCGY